MFDRFTDKAIKVIMLAQEESRRLQHNFVGTGQLLVGLIGEETGIVGHPCGSGQSGRCDRGGCRCNGATADLGQAGRRLARSVYARSSMSVR